MSREIAVHLDLDGRPLLCGMLWTRARPHESASFQYDASYLRRPGAFALDPDLPLAAGPHHIGRAVFRAFTDPAPDRWGQMLLRRAERARARREGRAPHALGPVEFLMRVSDLPRLGALRFRYADAGPDAPFEAATGAPVPPVVELPRLLSAARRVISETETDADLALLLAPGTSLGGARPKACVRATNGELLVAKFPRHDDEWPVTRWETTALCLARAAGIEVPAFRLELIAKKPVLLCGRFDRRGSVRKPFMSAMTALSAEDHETHSYLEIVDALRQTGSEPERDLVELYRRMVFNVLVSNTDDHLRNHGLVHDGLGWRLAPAYDLNPMPPDVRPRVHALALNETDQTGSIDNVLEVAPRFGLSRAAAGTIAREVAAAVRAWRTVARKVGLRPKDVERMQGAFDHDDLRAAAGA